MVRWLVLLILTVATATVSAQPSRAPSAATTATARLQSATTVIERRTRQVETQRRALTARYAEETAAIDRVKQQRSSWRQQRELKDKLATANDTAKQLTVVTTEHATLVAQLAASRRALIAAIDRELDAAPTATRRSTLDRLRLQVAPQRAPARRVARIVLPELELDPLADPEELDDHAAALRESEQQLLRQIAGLDKQAAELDEAARLRKQHDRAGELSRRDDDQPQRSAREGSARTFGAADEGAPTSGGGGSDGNDGGGQSPPGAVGGFEAEATIVLSEVVDASTLETLARASRTGDPAKRALAAKAARDAVRRRLLQLQKHRAQVESLAKQRRGK